MGGRLITTLCALAAVAAALAGNSAAAQLASPQPVIARSTQFFSVMPSTNGRAAVIEDRASHKVYVWRAGAAGLHLIGHGTGAVAVANDGQAAAYDCGSLTLCIWHLGRPLRRISEPCTNRALALRESQVEFMSDDLRTLLVRCYSSASVNLSLLIHVQVSGMSVRSFPGLDGLALSSDGTVALFGRGPSRAPRTAIYADGRLSSLPSVPYAFGMSHNSRFLIGGGNGATVPYRIYDRRTGQIRSFLPIAPSNLVINGDPFVISDSGRIVMYETGETPAETTCPEGACAIGVVDAATGRSAQLATARGATGIWPLALSADGTTAFYIEGHSGSDGLIVRSVVAP